MLWTQNRRAMKNEWWNCLFSPSDIHSIVCSFVVIGIGEVPLTWENTNEEEFWRKKGENKQECQVDKPCANGLQSTMSTSYSASCSFDQAAKNMKVMN